MNDYLSVIFSDTSSLVVIWTLGISIFCFLVGYFTSLLISLLYKIVR